jgi:hypothetical protein
MKYKGIYLPLAPVPGQSLGINPAKPQKEP